MWLDHQWVCTVSWRFLFVPWQWKNPFTTLSKRGKALIPTLDRQIAVVFQVEEQVRVGIIAFLLGTSKMEWHDFYSFIFAMSFYFFKRRSTFVQYHSSTKTVDQATLSTRGKSVVMIYSLLVVLLVLASCVETCCLERLSMSWRESHSCVCFLKAVHKTLQ